MLFIRTEQFYCKNTFNPDLKLIKKNNNNFIVFVREIQILWSQSNE